MLRQVLASVAPNVSCVVDAFGPVDLTAVPLLGPPLAVLLGSSPKRDPARYREASPLFAVTAQSAPMLIVQGSRDITVPPSQSLALQRALQAHGVAVQYLSYPGTHGFHGLSTDQLRGINARQLAYLVAQEHP